MMRTIDLFAGCGGLSLGFQNVGFDVIAAFDHWKPAIEVYRKNFLHPIQDVNLKELADYQMFVDLKPEIIIGGPPCQDYSSAGKRDESLGRADLTVTFAQIISTVRPNWFVMENVERIEKSANLKSAKQIFRAAGYGLSEAILNASLCGVPQHRKRFFLVGELNGADDVLLPYYHKNMTSQPMTIHDYLGDSLGLEYFYRHPRSYQRRAIFSIYEPSPTVRGVNRPIPSTYQPHPGDAAPITQALRPLTTIERSYIQTFPRDFVFTGSKTDLEQMIGNAVPVKLAEFVARSIRQYQDDRAQGISLTNLDSIQLELL
jgi:DNA (cytosine-5)-methyltransferase 1